LFLSTTPVTLKKFVFIHHTRHFFKEAPTGGSGGAVKYCYTRERGAGVTGTIRPPGVRLGVPLGPCADPRARASCCASCVLRVVRAARARRPARGGLRGGAAAGRRFIIYARRARWAPRAARWEIGSVYTMHCKSAAAALTSAAVTVQRLHHAL